MAGLYNNSDKVHVHSATILCALKQQMQSPFRSRASQNYRSNHCTESLGYNGGSCRPCEQVITGTMQTGSSIEEQRRDFLNVPLGNAISCAQG